MSVSAADDHVPKYLGKSYTIIMLCPSTIVHLIFAVLFYVITFAYYDTIVTKVLGTQIDMKPEDVLPTNAVSWLLSITGILLVACLLELLCKRQHTMVAWALAIIFDVVPVLVLISNLAAIDSLPVKQTDTSSKQTDASGSKVH